MRDELMDREGFESMAHAQAVGRLRGDEYKTERPNVSLADKTPVEYEAACGRYVPIEGPTAA